MIISASVRNSAGKNEVTVSTNDVQKMVTIPAKSDGMGSSVNGGELLFLALATCFCNDVYREAAKRKMQIESVEVTVTGNFGKEGEPGTDIEYTANVRSNNTPEEINDLIRHVDSVAEIHNTLRLGTEVKLRID